MKLVAPRNWPLSMRGAILAVMYAGLIVGSLMPGTAPSPQHGADVAVHTLSYAFATFVTIMLVGRPVRAAVAIFALSALLELAQEYVPTRNGTLEDLIANGVGVFVGIAGLGLLHLSGIWDWSHTARSPDPRH